MNETSRDAKNRSELLPWYLTGQLEASENSAVERWLQEDPQARLELSALRDLHLVVRSQSESRPSPKARERVLAYPSQKNSSSPPAATVAAHIFRLASLTLILLFCFWSLVQPGLVLEWSGPDRVDAYRIYRAGDHSVQFELLAEIPAGEEAGNYRYVDTLLLPGEEYRYRVEAIGSGGVLALSQTLTASAAQALPAQLTVVASAVLAAWALNRLTIAAVSSRSKLAPV